MKTKKFDCVEMKHRGGQKVYEAVKGMTAEQELAFWQSKTDELRARLNAKRDERAKRARRTA
ncbi:MAG: hypothetical protein Q7N50_09610 [Armatimonadota bacterium]|nr:hypothetical protein [Armatimonadota bacterium]